MPKFTRVLANVIVPETSIEIDILGFHNNKNWIVEYKSSIKSISHLNAINRIVHTYKVNFQLSKYWLIILNETTDKIKQFAKEQGIYLSTFNDFNKIKEMLD